MADLPITSTHLEFVSTWQVVTSAVDQLCAPLILYLCDPDGSPALLYAKVGTTSLLIHKNENHINLHINNNNNSNNINKKAEKH